MKGVALVKTVVSSSEIRTTIKYTNCAGEPFPNTDNNVFTLEDIERDIAALRKSLYGGLSDTSYLGAGDYVSVVSFPCMTDSSLRGVNFDGGPEDRKRFPRLEKIRFANLVTVGYINVRTT